jgi:hypothetical protein
LAWLWDLLETAHVVAALAAGCISKKTNTRRRLSWGTARVNYDFFGIGRQPARSAISVPMRQGGTIVYGELLRNFWKDIFIGGVSCSKSSTRE